MTLVVVVDVVVVDVVVVDVVFAEIIVVDTGVRDCSGIVLRQKHATNPMPCSAAGQL